MRLQDVEGPWVNACVGKQQPLQHAAQAHMGACLVSVASAAAALGVAEEIGPKIYLRRARGG